MKILKLGFILKDIGLSSIDMQNPERGNPGVGGSEFLFLLLIRYLSINKEKYRVVCYHFEDNILPEEVEDTKVGGISDVIEYAERDQVDYLIYQINWGTYLYELLSKTKLKGIAWAHCFVSKMELGMMSACANVKRVVFVGKEQYDTYIDHPVIDKSTFVYNIVPICFQNPDRNPEKKIVTYVGSLTKGKGFHILAREWPNILRRVPDAELFVLGNGKLYDRRSQMGSYNLAEASYEKSFIKYVTDCNGNILSCVHFMGIVGEEKDVIYRKTKVGVINPSAKTETFGMAAAEMEAYGIPIVTKGQYGLYDTVIHKKTGLLCQTRWGLRRSIIKLLNNTDYNMILGDNARDFVSSSFAPETLIPLWEKLLYEIDNDIPTVYTKPTSHYLNDFKFIRIANRYLKRAIHCEWFPAVCEIKRTY